jgi:hypothetical protein
VASTFRILEESQKDGMFYLKNQNDALYRLIYHQAYMYIFVFGVGDVSKEQKQPREC